MQDPIVITSRRTIHKRRRRFTREEVIKAAKKNLQRYIEGDTTVKVYF